MSSTINVVFTVCCDAEGFCNDMCDFLLRHNLQISIGSKPRQYIVNCPCELLASVTAEITSCGCAIDSSQCCE